MYFFSVFAKKNEKETVNYFPHQYSFFLFKIHENFKMDTKESLSNFIQKVVFYHSQIFYPLIYVFSELWQKKNNFL